MGVTQSSIKPTLREKAAKEQYQFELSKVVKAIKYKGKCNTYFFYSSFLRQNKTG
jgi:hypothetical protein